MSDPHFLDTNILMYAVGSEHPLKSRCLDIFRKISEGEIVAVTDTEVFQEIAYRYWCQKKWETAVEVLKKYEVLFNEIYPVEQKDIHIYYDLLAEYDFLSPRDAIHAAVMKSHQITKIFTADRALAKLPFFKTITP